MQGPFKRYDSQSVSGPTHRWTPTGIGRSVCRLFQRPTSMSTARALKTCGCRCCLLHCWKPATAARGIFSHIQDTPSPAQSQMRASIYQWFQWTQPAEHPFCLRSFHCHCHSASYPVKPASFLLLARIVYRTCPETLSMFPNSECRRSRVRSGSGPRSTASMFARRCAALLVPLKTASMPGS